MIEFDLKPESWKSEGICAQIDPELFFPERGGSTRDAKKICVGCEVRAQCLDYALREREEFGIWGGYSRYERTRLLTEARERARARKAA